MKVDIGKEFEDDLTVTSDRSSRKVTLTFNPVEITHAGTFQCYKGASGSSLVPDCGNITLIVASKCIMYVFLLDIYMYYTVEKS